MRTPRFANFPLLSRESILKRLVVCSLALCQLWCVVQVKGKAAIDVVCNPLGKSGGALIQQFMILSFGSLANSTPYLGMILLVIVTAWLAAAKSLEGQFNALRSEEELEKEMERASSVKIPVVSQDEEGSLGESSSSSPEKSAPTNI